MTALGIVSNHMSPGPAIRKRLSESLDFENVGDGADLDRANDSGHPDRQAIYVEFGGEHSSDLVGSDHVWFVWLIQRRDYPDWEIEYGNFRACIVHALDGWQAGTDVNDLSLLRGLCGIEDFPGLRVDVMAWRVSEIKFTR